MKKNTFTPWSVTISRYVFATSALFFLFLVFIPTSVKAQYVGGYIRNVTTGSTQPMTLNGATYFMTLNYGDYLDIHYDAPSNCSSAAVYDEMNPPQAPNPSFSIYNGQSGTNRYGPLYETTQIHQISMICWHYDGTTHFVAVGYKVNPPGGACGSAQGVYSAAAPSSGLCSVGSPSGVSSVSTCSSTAGCVDKGGGLWECPYDYYDGEEWITSYNFCSTNLTSVGWTWYCSGGNYALCTAPSQLPTGCVNNRDASGNTITNVTSYSSSPSGGKYKASTFGNYCWGNSGGPNYFVPMNTWAEFSSFWNNIQSGLNLSGLYKIP